MERRKGCSLKRVSMRKGVTTVSLIQRVVFPEGLKSHTTSSSYHRNEHTQITTRSSRNLFPWMRSRYVFGLSVPSGHPQRIKTMQSRIEKGSYHSLKAVKADFDLCFRNATHYNLEGSPIWIAARIMQVTFNFSINLLPKNCD